MLNISVKTLVRRPKLYITTPGSSRSDAIETLKRDRGYSIALVDRESMKLIGVISALDILKNPEEQQLPLITKRGYPTAKINDTLATVIEIMVENSVWEVPVVDDNGVFKGMIRSFDILRFLTTSKVNVEISNMYTKKVPIAWQGTPLPVLGRIMDFYSSPMVVILSDTGEPVGAVFIQDLLYEGEVKEERRSSTLGGISEGEEWDWNVSKVVIIYKSTLELPLKPAIDIMKDLPKVYHKSTVSSVAKTMYREGTCWAFAVDAKGRVEGIVSCLDLFKTVIS